MVLKLSTSLETCTGHRLMDYKGKCAHPHGHNYRWDISVAVDVQDRKYGMAMDFGDLKKLVADLLEPFDHSFVCRIDDPILMFLRSNGARRVVLNVNPTAENMAQWVSDMLVRDPKIISATVLLWETAKHSVAAMSSGLTHQDDVRPSIIEEMHT